MLKLGGVEFDVASIVIAGGVGLLNLESFR